MREADRTPEVGAFPVRSPVDETGGHGREEGGVCLIVVCVDACYAAHGGFLVGYLFIIY
jgi:hypothetical protein